MSRSSANNRINRGRKAGLSTRELYAALSAQAPEGNEEQPGQSDGNGYVVEIDEHGHRVYRPVTEEPR